MRKKSRNIIIIVLVLFLLSVFINFTLRENILTISKNKNAEEIGLNLTYEILTRDGDNVHILIKITDMENGIKQVHCPNGQIIDCTSEKIRTQLGIDYVVELGKSYEFNLISNSGEEKQEIILIEDYYHTVTYKLSKEIEISNTENVVAYKKPYQATITAGEGAIIREYSVTMGGEKVDVSYQDGKIEIK